MRITQILEFAGVINWFTCQHQPTISSLNQKSRYQPLFLETLEVKPKEAWCINDWACCFAKYG